MHASHESAHVENSVRHDVDRELDTQLIVCEQTYSLFADLRNKSDHQGVCAPAVVVRLGRAVLNAGVTSVPTHICLTRGTRTQHASQSLPKPICAGAP